MIDISNLEALIEECIAETESASRKKYDSEKADRTAAMFLTAQFKISSVIEDLEMKAKFSKNEVSRLEGDKYFEFKNSFTEKKATENMITSHIAKDANIVEAKAKCAKYESELKKWNYILSVLKDGHIFFRNLGKNKTWAE